MEISIWIGKEWYLEGVCRLFSPEGSHSVSNQLYYPAKCSHGISEYDIKGPFIFSRQWTLATAIDLGEQKACGISCNRPFHFHSVHLKVYTIICCVFSAGWWVPQGSTSKSGETQTLAFEVSPYLPHRWGREKKSDPHWNLPVFCFSVISFILE